MCASECWQLDELATCFGVFFVDFCAAKVKKKLISWHLLSNTIELLEQNGSMIKATFLRILRCDVVLNGYVNKRRHARYINRHVAFLLSRRCLYTCNWLCTLKKNEEGKLARFWCWSILFWWRACTFHSQYCYMLSGKKQAMLVQVDVSCVKGVIRKETLLTKEISY